MTSAGDPKTLQQSKNNLTYSLIGFIVVVSAYSIAKMSGMILKLPELFP